MIAISFSSIFISDASVVARPRRDGRGFKSQSRGWTEPGSYQPLAELAVQTETEVYLRMLHLSDGKEAGARRAAIAHQCVRQFGIATECAFGRPEEYAIPPF
jgi:hypothetical protein